MYIVSLGRFLFRHTNYVFTRASGASSGAFAAVCALCHIDASDCIRIYNEQQSKHHHVWPLDLLECFCRELLPEDCHHRCNGRIRIAAHQLSLTGFKRCIFTSFESKEDLIGAVLASASIPYITLPRLGYEYRGAYYVDGVYPEPFTDSIRILSVDLSNIDYPRCFSMSCTDPEVGSFAKRGLDDFTQWFQGGDSLVFSYTSITRSLWSRCLYHLLSRFPVVVVMVSMIVVYRRLRTTYCKHQTQDRSSLPRVTSKVI
jgi:hypothetical protein